MPRGGRFQSDTISGRSIPYTLRCRFRFHSFTKAPDETSLNRIDSFINLHERARKSTSPSGLKGFCLVMKEICFSDSDKVHFIIFNHLRTNYLSVRLGGNSQDLKCFSLLNIIFDIYFLHSVAPSRFHEVLGQNQSKLCF